LSLLLFLTNVPSTTEIYTLSLHDALPISGQALLTAAPKILKRGAAGQGVALALDVHRVNAVDLAPGNRGVLKRAEAEPGNRRSGDRARSFDLDRAQQRDHPAQARRRSRHRARARQQLSAPLCPQGPHQDRA